MFALTKSSMLPRSIQLIIWCIHGKSGRNFLTLVPGTSNRAWFINLFTFIFGDVMRIHKKEMSFCPVGYRFCSREFESHIFKYGKFFISIWVHYIYFYIYTAQISSSFCAQGTIYLMCLSSIKKKNLKKIQLYLFLKTKRKWLILSYTLSEYNSNK